MESNFEVGTKSNITEMENGEVEDFVGQLREDISVLAWSDKKEKEELYEYYLANHERFRQALRAGFNADAVIRELVKLSDFSDYDLSQNPEKNQFSSLAREVIYTYLEDIEDSLKQGKASPFFVFKAFASLAGDEKPQMVEAGTKALSKHLDEIKKIVESEKNAEAMLFIDPVFLNGDSIMSKKALGVILDLLDKRPYIKWAHYLISLLFDDRSRHRIEGESRLEEFLKTNNLDFRDFYSAWLLSTTEGPAKEFLHSDDKEQIKNFREVVDLNVRTIQAVEKVTPGASAWLAKEWGIRDFGRYPAEVLSAQFLGKGDINTPYGIVVMPREDWNGAFYNSNYPLKILYKDVKNEFNLRVAECQGKVELIRTLRKFNQTYNLRDGGRPISLIILGGHGTEHTIQFGRNWKKSEVLKLEDLDRALANEPKAYFDENPTFILASCSTGAEEGIGKEISKRYAAKVFAPKAPTFLLKIKAGKTKGGKWRFHAFYGKSESKQIFKQGVIA